MQSLESLQQALTEAETASQQKTELLSRTSHEIRTQLSAIIGNASLILETRLTPEQQEMIETIASSGDALLTLVNDLLDAGRLEAGRLTVERVPFRFIDVVVDSVSIFRASAEAKGVELRIDAQPGVPEVTVGDPSRLRQIVANLVGNAVKFTDRGAVEVRVMPRDGTHTEVSVLDSGPGIPGDQLSDIFRPYHQAANDPAGSGLGLAISRQLVDLMGGTMAVESEVGFGSNFSFVLPTPHLSDTEAVETQRSEIDGVPALLLTQDGRRAPLLAETLASIGLEVTTIASVDFAEQILKDSLVREHPYGLVLVDGDDPLDTCARLRMLPETGPTHLAVLTSNGRRGDGATCRELRVGAYLTQPLGSDDIAEAIQQVLMGPAPDDLTVLVTRHWLRERRRRLGVLVVDDSATHRMNLTRLFERRGHRVLTVSSGEAAIAEFEKHDFDVILMDIVMPGIGGIEAIRQIRSRWPDADTKIVAVTIEEDPLVHQQVLAAGADALLQRPFEVNDLFNAVDNLIALPVAAS